MNVPLPLFSFPVNLIVGLLVLAAGWRFKVLSERRVVVPTLSVVLTVCLVQGLAPAGISYTRTWVFVAVLVWLLVVLASCLFRQGTRMRPLAISSVTPLLAMGGLWLALFAGMADSCDATKGSLHVTRDSFNHTVYTQAPAPLVLPFELQLEAFSVTYYPDSQRPKQYAAHIRMRSTTEPNRETSVHELRVNRPLRCNGYRVLLMGYDNEQGSDTAYCTVSVTHQPWRGFVYAGIILMLLGAVSLLLHTIVHRTKNRTHPWFRALAIVLSFAFLLIVIRQMGLHRGQPVPILQSAWFLPHVVLYMVAYALCTVTFVCAVAGLCRNTWRTKTEPVIRLFTPLGYGLLTIGMLLGALWAHTAWGDFWSWDPKETWAAVTWLFYGLVLYAISEKTGPIKTKWLLVLVLCFMSLQMCWYGVNYLPSAAYSVHSYI